MARYYLHLRDFQGDVIEDHEGAEFLSLAPAREAALAAMHEFLAAAIAERAEPRIEAIVVADEEGRHLAAIPLIAALPSTVVGLLTRPDKVIPADRVEEYRKHAADCRHKAESTAEIDDKTAWLKLADAWLQMLPSTPAQGSDPSGWPAASEEDSTAFH